MGETGVRGWIVVAVVCAVLAGAIAATALHRGLVRCTGGLAPIVDVPSGWEAEPAIPIDETSTTIGEFAIAFEVADPKYHQGYSRIRIYDPNGCREPSFALGDRWPKTIHPTKGDVFVVTGEDDKPLGAFRRVPAAHVESRDGSTTFVGVAFAVAALVAIGGIASRRPRGGAIASIVLGIVSVLGVEIAGFFERLGQMR